MTICGTSSGIVVLAVHLGLIAVFMTSRNLPQDTAPEAPGMTVVFLPPMPTGKPEPLPPPRPVISASAPLPEIIAITPELDEIEAVPESRPSIDWSKEAALAAVRQIDSMEDARRRSTQIKPREGNREPTRASQPEFGWSHSQTHRFEPLAEGGTLLWLNERCALVISAALFPVCQIGKIETRGDLFDHMRDAPEPGDWKEQ